MGTFQYCSSLTDVYYTGTEQQWRNIDIDNYGNYNNPLINATIHYNSKMPEQTPVPTAKPIGETVLVGKYEENITLETNVHNNKIEFTATALSDIGIPEEMDIYVAQYDANGTMTGIKKAESGFTDGECRVSADMPESGSYKVMLWDENNTPVIEAISGGI